MAQSLTPLSLLQSLFNRLVSLTEEARKAYKDMVSALEQEQAEEAMKNDKKTPHQLGHYRNHSAASAISFCSILSEPISEVNEKEYGEETQLCHYHEKHFDQTFYQTWISVLLTFSFTFRFGGLSVKDKYLNNLAVWACSAQWF